jgi:hypothetical protein
MDRRSAAKGVTEPAPSGQWRGSPVAVDLESDLQRPSVRRMGPAGEVIPATQRERAGWVLAGGLPPSTTVPVVGAGLAGITIRPPHACGVPSDAV